MRPSIVPAPIPESLAGVNFAHGRLGKSGVACPYPVDVIVVHVTEGSAASARDWFTNPTPVGNGGKPSGVSSHYLVSKLGTIVQFVAEDDRAFHAGQLVNPSSSLVIDRFANGGWTPNSYGIGIENEGDGTEELTDRQRAALYELMTDIIMRRGIPLDRDHIIGHREVKASKTCPGQISVDRIVSDLASHVPSPTPIVPPSEGHPRVVWSNVLSDYVFVVRYVSDTEWYYRTLKSLDNADAKRAGAPLSEMPLHPGDAV